MLSNRLTKLFLSNIQYLTLYNYKSEEHMNNYIIV